MYSFYSYKKKKPIGLIITIIICTIIVLITGYFVYKALTTPLPFKERAITTEEESNIAANNTQKNDLRYKKSTEYNHTKNYACGHNTTEKTIIPDNFVDKTINEIKEENKDIEITQYNDFSISATEYISGQCDNHYIIKLNGNKLTSYNVNSPDITVKETTVNLKEFYDNDIEILKNGIEVGSKDELLEFFEDFA